MGAACGSDHEFLSTKFRLKLKKVGKTTRRFRYDLNRIPYDYTVEVANRRGKVEAVTDFIFLGSKMTMDDACSHELKRRFLLGRKPMTNLVIVV